MGSILQMARVMKSVVVQSPSRGVYFDLGPMFHDLNRRFFNDRIAADLKWGIRRTEKTKRSIRLGSYRPQTKTIVIHPCLDQAIVPMICVERILFHEMLHQHLPAKKDRAGKNCIHHREFNEFEKNYPYLKEADSWIKANLKRLLTF